MKRTICIIASFLMISFFAEAQISLDSVSYKAFQVAIYFNGQKRMSSSDVIFSIHDNKMISTSDNQYKSVRFIETPASADIGTYNENLFARSLDKGGNRCSFYIIHTPAENTKSGKEAIYTIAIQYSNILFMYECYLTDESPWDIHPLDLNILLEQNNLYESNPEYTDEEVIEFFDQFGNGKLIKEAIVRDFYMESMIINQ